MHGYFGYGFPGNGYYGGMGFSWFGLIFMVVGIAIVVSLIVMGFRLINSRVGHNEKSRANDIENNGNALSLLAERLARGEITKEEYQDLKETIKKG
jgi:uncharacterized membrane protein